MPAHNLPVSCKCVKCKPAQYISDKDISSPPWMLKKDGTCVQCKDEFCLKCNPNKPSQCIQCNVSAS